MVANSSEEEQTENRALPSWITRRAPWAVAATFAFLWILEIYPAAPQWGTVADWFTVAATAGGLYFAAVQISHFADQRREAIRDDRLMQSRDVAIASGLMSPDSSKNEIWIEVRNATSRPIFAVVVLVLQPGAVVSAGTKQTEAVHQIYFGAVLPGGTRDYQINLAFDRDPSLGEATRICALLFSDSWGQHWIRQDRSVFARTSAATLE